MEMVFVVVAAVPPWLAAIAGADQTGGYVYTPKSIECRNKNANLQDRKYDIQVRANIPNLHFCVMFTRSRVLWPSPANLN